MKAVRDASAVIAHLLRETGGDMVFEALTDGALVTSVNLTEVLQRYADARGSIADGLAMLERLPVAIVDFDRELAIDAAALRAITRPIGLSLGDRACLALARRAGVVALTTDHDMAGAADVVGVRVHLIR